MELEYNRRPTLANCDSLISEAAASAPKSVGGRKIFKLPQPGDGQDSTETTDLLSISPSALPVKSPSTPGLPALALRVFDQTAELVGMDKVKGNPQGVERSKDNVSSGEVRDYSKSPIQPSSGLQEDMQINDFDAPPAALLDEQIDAAVNLSEEGADVPDFGGGRAGEFSATASAPKMSKTSALVITQADKIQEACGLVALELRVFIEDDFKGRFVSVQKISSLGPHNM